MADNQKITKKTSQASAKHYWGKNAHLANGEGSSSSKKNSSTGKKVAAGVTLGVATTVVAKSAKRTNSKTLAAIIISFILALAIGLGVCFVMGKNDEFTLLGDEVIYLSTEETYKDDGVKIIEYGMDISKNAVVKTNLKVNEDGEYYADEELLASGPNQFYICYTVKSIKFGFVYNVQKIRLITFTDMSEGGE